MKRSHFNRLYYGLKPYLPKSLRMAIRRQVAWRVRRGSGQVWPILESASRPPAGWSGWPDGKRFAVVLTHDIEGARGVGKSRQLAEFDRLLDEQLDRERKRVSLLASD